ncbi:hypothetical protein [Paraburkholderia phenoliruptrix]|nr:hypothetical protein [Paraburkholderia phenoliruptrix]MBW0449023.1 hypothetical protein [Paraburkholderia phenoliruptrix]MBW9097432.1 hypothetical protein [Paraburkholderia phenoliruptrix]
MASTSEVVLTTASVHAAHAMAFPISGISLIVIKRDYALAEHWKKGHV